MAKAISFAAIAASPKGKDAFAGSVAFETGNDGKVLPVLMKYIGVFPPEHAEQIDATIKKLVAAKREKESGIRQTIPLRSSPRTSEMAGMLKLPQWACYREFLKELATMSLPLATIVFVTTWFRRSADKQGAGIDKKTGKCPSRKVILEVVARKKAQTTKKKRNPADAAKRDIVAFVDDTLANVKALSSVYAAFDGNALVTAALKALASYRPIAVKIAKAQEK